MGELSITRNLLTGPFHRLDITEPTEQPTVVSSKPSKGRHYEITKEADDKTVKMTFTPKPMMEATIKLPSLKINWLNICGWFPGVSTVSGLSRAVLGLVHTVYHFAKAHFDSKNKSEHLQEAKLGAYNFARGIVEAVPLAGNLIVLTYDLVRYIELQRKFDLRHLNKMDENLSRDFKAAMA